jgi:hypothetical protein
MKVIDYTIVTGYCEQQLIVAVREYINKGWTPQGGMTLDATRGTYHQAIVRFESKASQ